jgi:tripartite-type tricarboxylate transporter receptor subunit TctC
MLTGARMLHVPYKGTGPALSAMLAGETQAMIAAAPGTISYIRGGKLRALGVTGDKRWPVMPELPTLMEAGIKDFEFTTWYGLFVPRGTSPEIVSKLNTTANKMLTMPDVKEQMQRGGLEAAGGTPESFTVFFRSEVEKLGKVIRTTGAKP